MAVPDRDEWLRALDALLARTARQGRRTLDDKGQALDWLQRRLVAGSPALRVARQQDKLREIRGRMSAAMRAKIHGSRNNLQSLGAALLQVSPAVRVQQSISQLAQLRQRLTVAGRRAVSKPRHALQVAARALDAVSPLATLDRGYAIVTDASGKALMRARDVKQGDDIRARLAEGELIATIREVIDADK